MKTAAKGASMPVSTVPFMVEDEIAGGIACGIYKQYGEVIRWAVGPQKGQIVKHLEPIVSQQSEGASKALSKAAEVVGQQTAQASKVLAKVTELAKVNKKPVVAGAAVVAGVAAVGTACYAISKREPKELKTFRSALEDYLEDAKNQALRIEETSRLKASVEKLMARKDFEKIRLELSAQDLATLVNEISRYTARFAEANSIEAGEDLKQASASDDSLLHLIKCLDIQKQVFEEAA